MLVHNDVPDVPDPERGLLDGEVKEEEVEEKPKQDPFQRMFGSKTRVHARDMVDSGVFLGILSTPNSLG